MTSDEEMNETTEQQGGASTWLPFDPQDMATVRVRPATFARMMGVSKQAVSKWIASEKIRLGADGRLDPNEAARQVVQNSDPGRLRARVLRSATEETSALRKEVERFRSEVEAAKQRVNYLEALTRELDCGHELLIELIAERWEELREVPGSEIGAALRELDDFAILACGRDSYDEAGQYINRV